MSEEKKCQCGHVQSEHGPMVDYDSDGMCYGDRGECPCDKFAAE
jgi:hypothetical protein